MPYHIEDGPVAEVLLNAIQRERERIERAKKEIRRLKDDLEDLGWEPPSKEWWDEEL